MTQVTFIEMCKYIFCCKAEPRIESIMNTALMSVV